MDEYTYFKEALKDRSKPCLFLHLNALQRNIRQIERKALNKQIRVATKSIRSVEVLRYILDSSPVFQGLMCFSAAEALFLREKGFTDILIAYPVWDRKQLMEIAHATNQDESITVMVDSIEHVKRLDAIANEESASFQVSIDMDVSMKLPGLHFGVYRSALRKPKDVLQLAKIIQQSAALHLDGVMGYEAQVAGVTDNDSRQHTKNVLIRQLKKKSLKKIHKKRKQLIKSFQKEEIPLRFINGGGTGSLEETVKEASITEVTVGSGFFSSHLFDKYRGFQYDPALGFAIEITRNPEKKIFTCLGGGYMASGPANEDKLPEIYLPEGASLIVNEGPGEVQTPVFYNGDRNLKLGDPILFRHSKAGEICERFQNIVVVENGKWTATYQTYRGEGKCFL